MFIKKNSKAKPQLADMHIDGTRFDSKILEALRALKKNQGNTEQNATDNGQ